MVRQRLEQRIDHLFAPLKRPVRRGNGAARLELCAGRQKVHAVSPVVKASEELQQKDLFWAVFTDEIDFMNMTPTSGNVKINHEGRFTFKGESAFSQAAAAQNFASFLKTDYGKDLLKTIGLNYGDVTIEQDGKEVKCSFPVPEATLISFINSSLETIFLKVTKKK